MNKLRPTLLITALLTLGLAGTTQAAVQHLNLPVCSLAVYPYNPAQPEIYNDAAVPFVNFLSESICKSRTTYGQSYKQPVVKSENPVKSVADIENKNVPYAIHRHSYINNALEDSYYYRSYIDKFEIKLESDALNNTQKFQIQCQTPAPGGFSGSADDLSDCNGSVNDINFYGGVKVSYNSNTGVVTWEFGTVQKNLRPNMWGNNDSNPADSDNFNEALTAAFGVAANLNDTNSVYRKFTPAVQLKTKNNSTEVWSGTTTSRVLIRNYAILKSSFNALPSGIAKFSTLCSSLGDYTKWCPVDTPAGQGYATEQLGNSGQQQWFWFPIGSVVSVWSKPAPAPELACADLQWDGPFLKKNSLSVFVPATKNPNALLPNEEAVMKFKTIYESGSGPKRPLEYRWVSFYGDQNRPAWFKNDDMLYVLQLGPLFTTNLPFEMLKIAHAATPSLGSTALDPSVTAGSMSAAEAAALAAITNIGKFKDELASGLSLNPMTDDDNQAYYSGGSEGVILGVQAFYADGKNVAGQGAMVNTPGGLKQKAEPCHLELVVQPAPAICIDLDISPKDIKPNTPVTFTVTPKFSPADKTIPLNYYWNAKASSSGVIGAAFDPSKIGQIVFDPSIIQAIPGGTSSPGSSNPSWTVQGLGDLIDTGLGIGGLIDPCANGGCETIPPKFDFGGPVEAGQLDFDATGVSSPDLGSGINTKDFGPVFGGANIFEDFAEVGSEYGKAALPSPGAVSASVGSLSGASSAVSGVSSVLPSLGASSNDQIDKDAATMDEILYGGFKDVQGGPLTPTNPFLETVDNKTYYTGGPAGTLITVEGRGKDGTVYPPCKDSLIIPAIPLTPKCQQLKVKFFDGSTEVAKENLVAGKPYTIEVDQANSKLTDGSPITKYSIFLNNADGPGAYGTLAKAPGSAPSCPDIEGAAGTISAFQAAVSCKYVYTPKAKDKIRIEAVPTDGVAACTIEQVIPETPVGPICKALNLTTTPSIIPGNQIPLNTQIALATDPRDTNNNLRDPIVYEKQGAGVFIINVTNASSCPVPSNTAGFYTFEAPSSCKYSFLATSAAASGDYLSVKVKQDDGVAACKATFPIVEVPKEEEICLSLNFKVNGAYTLNPLITPGSSYSLQADPITTKGNPITMVEWTENGSGQLVGEAGNPGICPAAINNGSVVTPAFCRYIYSSPSGASDTDGFSVRAVPDNGVAACRAKAEKFNPPKENPYCLYLDLDYTPEPFNPLTTSQMNATVVMSDGSKYNDNVRFTSTNGAGSFTGGFAPTSGSGTSNFRSKTDATNNTQTVTYSGGNEDTGINVFLSDTSIVQTAACQRQLKPVKKPEYKCELPPNIVRDGLKFTAEGGDSDEYCWSISGAGNPLFTNGKNTATGDSVVLDENYTSFDLRVEDCNPKFRDFCSDEYEVDNTPNINKRISKNSSPLRYGTKINYSTTGSGSTETVAYKIDFTPTNYQPGTYMIAKIYDPAFTGKLQGYKTDANGAGKTAGGTVDFNNIETTLKVSGFSGLCSGSPTPKDKCYSVNKSAGFLQLNGITSADKISIEYTGLLKSGITLQDCRDGKYCNEQFINQSFVTDMAFCVEKIGEGGSVTYECTDAPKPSDQKCEYFYNDKGERVPVGGNAKDCEMPKFTMATNTTVAELVCQYFLTRASGDIFLEDELKYGIDVSKCYPFKNISSTITKPTTPIPPSAPKTGTAEIVTINHEICSAGQSNFTGFKDNAQKEALMKLFGADISKLSSQICEVGLVPGSDWDKASINASMAQNIGKLTRWDDGINPGNSISNVSDILAEGRVYYYKGTGSETVTVNGLSIPEGSGALTIIVENADLQINGNIEYAVGTPADTADKISSLGVIVIDGNMYVGKDVEKLAGAYFVQRTEADNYTVGNVLSGSEGSIQQSEKLLTVNGSIYGNIGPLFENRVAAGDISKDEGAITIRYDQRIIQNPPAGLSQILGDFSQSQIAQ